MVKLTRRRLLISGGATAVVAAAGVGYVVSGDAVDFVATLLRRTLSSEKIVPGATEEFAHHYLELERHEDMDRVRQLTWMYRSLGYEGMEAMVGAYAPYLNFKRRVATAFMLSSNFFDRQSPEVPVEYLQLTMVCRNPFARFA